MVEDSIHAIRDCPSSKEAWSALIPLELRGQLFSTDLHGWLSSNLAFRRADGLHSIWPETMAITSWNLWKWRCAEVMENSEIPLILKLDHIKLGIEETKYAFEGEQAH